MLIRWGWIDYAGREKQWFDWNKPLRFAPEESGRSQSSRPNPPGNGPRGLNEKRNYGKDDKEVSQSHRRSSSQLVRPPYRGSRPTGQRTDQGRGSSPQGR